MGGEEHRDPGLQNTARKYDEFRKYLQAVRLQRSSRKPGASVLEDTDTVASAASSEGCRGADDMDRDAVKQHARQAKHAALAELGVDDVSALSSSASLALSVWSYGTVNDQEPPNQAYLNAVYSWLCPQLLPNTSLSLSLSLFLCFFQSLVFFSLRGPRVR
jgi:hypothetical protein